MGYVLTVVAEQDNDWPFLPRSNCCTTWALAVLDTKKMPCSSGLSSSSPSSSMPCQSRSASNLLSTHKPFKPFPLPFLSFRKRWVLLPVSICCRNFCAVTLSWGCRMGLYSCLFLELFCFKQEQLLIRVKHSLMPCTKSEDILWTKPMKSRRSCMHRPHSWPIVVPTAAQSKKKRKAMETKVSSQFVRFLH